MKRRLFWFTLGIAAALIVQNSIETTNAESLTDSERYAVITEETPTVWDLVRRELPEMDPQKAVFEVKRLNKGIDFGRVQLGQRIQLPKDGE